MLLAVLWAFLGMFSDAGKTVSGQNWHVETASWKATPLQAAPRLGFAGLGLKDATAPPVAPNASSAGSAASTAATTAGKVFTSTDPIVGETATSINNALPGAVRDVNVPIKNPTLNMSSDADIQLANGDVVEVKSGGGTGATTQVSNQQKIIGDSGEVIVYGPNLKGSVINGLQNNGVNVFTNMNDLLNYIKSKGM